MIETGLPLRAKRQRMPINRSLTLSFCTVMHVTRWVYTTFLLFGISACMGAGAMAPDPGETTTGEASYYADRFIGQRTASGERYDPDALTAAHRSLPFGTQVRVTRLSNGQSVVVRINDRGPFVRGRVIDVSHAAARRLDMMREGVVSVTVEVISAGRGSRSARQM